jgi:hypothetical protein
VDHGTILDTVTQLRSAGTPVTSLSIAAALGVDDPELLEDIGDAVEELVEAGRLVRVETPTIIGGKPAPFPTITYQPTA